MDIYISMYNIILVKHVFAVHTFTYNNRKLTVSKNFKMFVPVFSLFLSPSSPPLPPSSTKLSYFKNGSKKVELNGIRDLKQKRA